VKTDVQCDTYHEVSRAPSFWTSQRSDSCIAVAIAYRHLGKVSSEHTCHIVGGVRLL
jgi:hypothetical protein